MVLDAGESRWLLRAGLTVFQSFVIDLLIWANCLYCPVYSLSQSLPSVGPCALFVAAPSSESPEPRVDPRVDREDDCRAALRRGLSRGGAGFFGVGRSAGSGVEAAGASGSLSLVAAGVEFVSSSSAGATLTHWPSVFTRGSRPLTPRCARGLLVAEFVTPRLCAAFRWCAVLL